MFRCAQHDKRFLSSLVQIAGRLNLNQGNQTKIPRYTRNDKIIIENTSKRPGLSVFLDGIKQRNQVSYGDNIVIKKGDVVKLAFYNQKKFFEKRIDISSRYRKG